MKCYKISVSPVKGDSHSFFKGLGVSCLNDTSEQFVPVFHFLVRKLYYL